MNPRFPIGSLVLILLLCSQASANAAGGPLVLEDVLGERLALGSQQAEPTIFIFMSRSAKDESAVFARTIDEQLLDRAVKEVGVVDVRRYGGILRRVAMSYLRRSVVQAREHRHDRRVEHGVDASPEAVDRWHLVGDFDGSVFARFGVGAEPARPVAFVLDRAGALHGPYREVAPVVHAVTAALHAR